MSELYKTEIEEEFENDGFLSILIPGIGIFLLFAFLAKIGFQPGEVWSFIKMLFLLSTWDYQMRFEFTQFLRAGTSLFSVIGLSLVVVIALIIIDTVINFIKSSKLLVFKIFHALFALIYKFIMFLGVCNLILLIIRVMYHVVAGILVWLW
ncbi:hypothetical protein [Cytobacillus pseudoceanisediminis]|uniref:hypothetical protein n=1 Tax=Cytobacillus pseudoceanisediminis TaxID=3051614 RepID=UPI003C2C5319